MPGGFAGWWVGGLVCWLVGWFVDDCGLVKVKVFCVVSIFPVSVCLLVCVSIDQFVPVCPPSMCVSLPYSVSRCHSLSLSFLFCLRLPLSIEDLVERN